MVCLMVCFSCCKSLLNVTSIREYSNFLFNRFVLPQYQSHVIEVHLLFDSKINDGTFNPKAFEQKKETVAKVVHQSTPT